MKNLFTSYLLLIIFALINSNVVLAQYSNATLNGSRFIYLEPLNPSCFSSENNYNIYPNPNNGTFYFRLKNANSKIQIEIYNLSGQKVYEASNMKKQTSNEINFAPQSKGVYLIKINDGENSYSEKILIQ
jgi:hypothetical protein